MSAADGMWPVAARVHYMERGKRKLETVTEIWSDEEPHKVSATIIRKPLVFKSAPRNFVAG